MTALKGLESNSTIIQTIIEINSKFAHTNGEVLFSWIPAHVDIKGNKNVDSKLISSVFAYSANYEPTFYKDLQKYFINATIKLWGEEWKNARSTKLHEIRNSVYNANPTLRLNRKEQILVTRIKIGHTNWTYSYLITNTEPNTYNPCILSISIKYILTAYPKYKDKRK